MNKTSYQIILRPLVTEKGMSGSEQGKFPFEVDIRSNKQQIKKAVQELFSVHVREVRTMIRSGKRRRYGRHQGVTRAWKRAIVTLAPGETIEFI